MLDLPRAHGLVLAPVGYVLLVETCKVHVKSMWNSVKSSLCLHCGRLWQRGGSRELLEPFPVAVLACLSSMQLSSALPYTLYLYLCWGDMEGMYPTHCHRCRCSLRLLFKPLFVGQAITCHENLGRLTLPWVLNNLNGITYSITPTLAYIIAGDVASICLCHSYFENIKHLLGTEIVHQVSAWNFCKKNRNFIMETLALRTHP